MKKTYIIPSIKVHQTVAKSQLLVGSGSPSLSINRDAETYEQW